MTTSSKLHMHPWLGFLWWISIVPSFLAIGRIVYESTILTWRSGPQNIGFTMIHTSPIFIGLLAFSLLIYVWTVLAVISFLRRRFIVSLQDWSKFISALIIIGLANIPYSKWQYFTTLIAGIGPHATEQLIHAAATHDLGLVQYFVEHNVPIDGDEDSSPLIAASIQGDTAIVTYLLTRGANPNLTKGILRRSALADAASMGQTEVVKILLKSGADKSVTDRDSLTVTEIALKNHHDDIAELLKQDPH